MTQTQLLIYQKTEGRVPLASWLSRQSRQVQNKTVAIITLLKERGHGLRRPHADYLANGIWELRVIVGRVHHRILYCYVGKRVVLLTHAITKTNKVPAKEIQKAARFRDEFKKDPKAHACSLEALL